MFKKLLIATAILATSSNIAMASVSPLYLGAGLGVNNITASNAGSYRGLPLSIFGGYGTTVNKNIYLAGELFGTVGTLTLTNSSFGGAGLRNTYGYGASFIPGLMMSDRTLAFVRLGVVRTRFSSSIKSTATGGQVGLGMQTNLMQNWDIRGEYDYTQYGSVSGVTPRSDLFNFGIVYKID